MLKQNSKVDLKDKENVTFHTPAMNSRDKVAGVSFPKSILKKSRLEAIRFWRCLMFVLLNLLLPMTRLDLFSNNPGAFKSLIDSHGQNLLRFPAIFNITANKFLMFSISFV